MEQPDFRPLAALLKHLSAGDLVDVRKAYDFAVAAHAGQTRENGSPYVTHAIQVAEIVAQWKADRDTVIAALLHDVLEDTSVTKEEIAMKFGRKAALLVEGITKFTNADLSPDLPLDRKIETLRKLFDIMRLDMRSILIKLADRLHNVRTIDALPGAERRRRFALETLTVYYKIAFHLGLRNTRRIFAEYCVPHAYDTGKDEQVLRNTMCQNAASVPGSLERELKKHGESFDLVSVSLIPRNLLIFHERTEEKGGNPLPQDAFSISVIVRTEDDCYQLLKTLHTLYRPVSGQFRDFIAAPSDAGYQSLHTFVSLPEGVVIEVRIRTPEMFEQAMSGVAGIIFDPAAPALLNFSWLKRSESLDLKTRDSSTAFWEALESDILRETISVNVDRKRMSLPKGSTALDAAYALYDDRAGNTSGLTLNGRPVPGSEVLKEDDEVHITLDAKHQHAAFEWLQMVSTRHARFHIVDVLKKTEKSEKIALGATLLQKEFDHYNKGLLSGLSRGHAQEVAKNFRRETFDQVLSMIGEGVIRARDVLFFLFPDKKVLPFTKPGKHSFHLHIAAGEQPGQDLLSQLDGLIRLSDVTISNIRVQPHPNRGLTDIFVSGSCQDRLQFADFIEQLERQEWISAIRSLIPRRQKIFLICAFIVAFGFVFLDLVLFPAYQQALAHLSFAPRFLIQSLPLLPIFILNYYLLRLLRNYVVRMRSELWYLGIGLLLNVIGLMLLVLRTLLTGGEKASLLPLITIFVLSLVYMGYRFFETDALFAPFDRSTKSLSAREWTALRKRKIAGYLIRIVAVVIWGIEPIYIRYTPANDLSPFIRIFLLGFGVLVVSFVALFFRQMWVKYKGTKSPVSIFRIPHEKFFICLVIGQIGFMYLKNASLVHTTGTNLLLFNNFAPVLGLLVAAVFWRREIPYLKKPKTMLWIFLLAVTAGLGSSLLVYSSSVTGSASLIGDILAFIAALFDVVLVVAQIQYIKNFGKTDPAVLNLHVFFYLLLLVSPVIILAAIFQWPVFGSLTAKAVLLGIGIGLFEGVGQMCNYAAFKRIDGYLAHMMFNLSIFITFSIEAFVIHSVRPTFLLMASGIIIIGASVAAELINSRCQKKGL